jgi:GNAT superfamily N-acetyltransferase
MSYYFKAESSPTNDSIDKISCLTPRTPFNTPAYAAANITLGAKPCILALKSGNEIVFGCLGFLWSGILSRRLEILTAPLVPEPEVFWNGVRDFCLKQAVWELDIQSYGSDATDVPLLQGELSRHDRFEFLIDLTSPNPLGLMSTGHRRNINHARKMGLTIQRTCEVEAASSHLSLIEASMRRRKKRGEDVLVPAETRFFEAILKTGAGEIFQATDGENVMSSMMILRSSDSAYYQSAGTSPEGMKLGASMFLISEVANLLKKEGVSLFNLGGAAQDEQGLQRFKGGFGARKVKLEAATFSMASPIKQRLRKAVKLIFRNPSAFLAALLTVERYLVFSGDPVEISKHAEIQEGEHITFRKITDEELIKLSGTADYQEQAERFRRTGFNAAYGCYLGEGLAHVQWLIDSRLDHKNKVRNLKLRAGEGEITHGLTSEQYRGRGFAAVSIRRMCDIAASKGIKTIFMTTGEKNLSAQRTIAKGGLSRCAKIYRISLSVGPEWLSLTWRGHRWKIW